MADGHYPTPDDVLHPPKRAKPRSTTSPSRPRHVRPVARTVTVRRAVDSFLLARFAAFAEEHRWPGTDEVASDHVRAWLAGLNRPSARTGKPLSKARKNKCGAVVRTFLRWAVAEGLVPAAAIHNIRWPRAPKMTDSMITIGPEELQRLLSACDPRT